MRNCAFARSDAADGDTWRLALLAGRVLADEATLGSAGIRPEACTLHVAVRPPGVPPREAAPPPDDDAVPDLEQGGLRDEDLLALRVALEAELRAMAAQPAGSLGRGRAREGDISDFALGCAVGLFLGFVAMMCLLEPTATRRMRAGLFLGACARSVWGGRVLRRFVVRALLKRVASQGCA